MRSSSLSLETTSCHCSVVSSVSSAIVVFQKVNVYKVYRKFSTVYPHILTPVENLWITTSQSDVWPVENYLLVFNCLTE